MLSRLTIQNYALIDCLDISFPDNLVIITGETGAGKSILLGALSLVLGGRSDISTLKDRTRNCVVEAIFTLEEGRECILRRVISPNGRSRIFVDDEPATLEHIRNLSESLVDIHSQHQHLLLSRTGFQTSILDHFAGLTLQVSEYEAEHAKYLSVCREISDLEQKIAEAARTRDYLEYQYAQLERASLVEGELEELEAEQAQLANSEEILQSISRMEFLFQGEEESISSHLKEIESLLERLSSFIPEFRPLAERISSSRIELKDIESEILGRGGSVVTSPQRLQMVDERLSVLYDLMRKHAVGSISELISLRESLGAQLGKSLDLSLEKEAAEKRRDTLKSSCDARAEAIFNQRSQAAPLLSQEIEEAVRALEMPFALFSVKVDREGAVFLFSANGGEVRELSKCASGGELSRIMLVIKGLMAQYVGMPTMIFDEIDAGVSGSVADKMGRKIVDMGRNMQIFAITHLPQVASKGSAHYLVYKIIEESDEPRTQIKYIEGDERVWEIARMLSGSKLTEEALANARVLLQSE
jgi:DNA repair protein RecN (Recombination protein N)